jgi:hypothetical protein
MAVDRGEHVVREAEQLLDPVYRARSGGLTRWCEDGREVCVDAIWHEPTVQGSAGSTLSGSRHWSRLLRPTG